LGDISHLNHNNFYTENYKSSLREFKHDLKYWRDIPYPYIIKLSSVKIPISHNSIDRLKAIPTGISEDVL
jgi:hypothetical protein